MFRLVEQPPSFRQRASEWIYKMLFLWTKEPNPGPRASPWFAWFATAFVIWRCRRRIIKAILTASPLRLLRKRCAKVPSTSLTNSKILNKRNQKSTLVLHTAKQTSGIKTRVKRLCTGDGFHVSPIPTILETQQHQQINYKVTRSGKVYGKYTPSRNTVIPKK